MDLVLQVAEVLEVVVVVKVEVVVVLVAEVLVVVVVAGNRADFLKEVVATEGMEVAEEVSTRVAA